MPRADNCRCDDDDSFTCGECLKQTFVSEAVIHDSIIRVGHTVLWMSGGTQSGTVLNIRQRFSTVCYKMVYDVLVKDWKGEMFWLNTANQYGIRDAETS